VAELLTCAAAIALLWAAAEGAMRWWITRPLARGFYGGLSRAAVREHQERHGVRGVSGPGWVHLGWVADPDAEHYAIERLEGAGWCPCGSARTGSFLIEGGVTGGEALYRVRAIPTGGDPDRVVGEVRAAPEPGVPPLRRPVVSGPWRPIFRPRRHGRYVNDHAVFRDGEGRWRLLGITSDSDGDFDRERWLAQASSDDFPPRDEMREEPPVADFGDLAWAPHVVESGGRFLLYWSPHRLHRMTSADGIHWGEHRVVLDPPFHRFFRDASVLEVAPGQWLLYATARGRYYSRVDVYQSFDLEHWQYIRAALRTGPGCERASPFASTESPWVVRHEGRHYLSLTYNNDSFFWPGILLLFRKWLGRASYNDTRVFHSANPYDFGVYRGRRRPSRQIARLEAHAPRLIRHPESGEWWITSAGWPWVATLTSGEVAVAPLRWEEVDAEAPGRGATRATVAP